MLVFSEFGEVTPLPALIPCHSREEEEEHCQLQTGFRPETAELSKVTKGQLRGREHCFPEQGPPSIGPRLYCHRFRFKFQEGPGNWFQYSQFGN